MRPILEQAVKLEKQVHSKIQDQKSANWLLKTAKDADLEPDEEILYEINEKLGTKVDLKSMKFSNLKNFDLSKFQEATNSAERGPSKQQKRDQALKSNYDKEIQKQ